MSLAAESARYLVSECERRLPQWADVGFSAAETVWNCSKLVEATLGRAATRRGPYTVPMLESALPPVVDTISLRIVTQPPGAQVRIGGTFVGSTPIEGVNIKAHVVYNFVLTRSGVGEKTVTFIANEFEATQLLFVYLE